MKTSDVKMTEPEARVQHVSNRREIPVFGGQPNEIFQEWIGIVESHLEGTHYPSAEWSSVLVEHVKGEAYIYSIERFEPRVCRVSVSGSN